MFITKFNFVTENALQNCVQGCKNRRKTEILRFISWLQDNFAYCNHETKTVTKEKLQICVRTLLMRVTNIFNEYPWM